MTSSAIPFQSYVPHYGQPPAGLPVFPVTQSPCSLPLSPPLAFGPHSSASPQPLTPKAKASHLAMAGLLFTVGLVTHHLPGAAQKTKGFKFLLPPDWKSWARVGLGIVSVNQFNKGIGWNPPPWVTGLLSAGIITPMALRFRKTTGLTLLLIAPLVAASVQTSQWMNQAFTKDLRRDWNIPEPLSRLMISLSVGGLGALSAMAAHKYAPGWKLFGKKIFAPLAEKEKSLGAFAAPSCARGCTPSIICLSEVGETIGGMTDWFKRRQNSSQQSDNNQS